jgi:type IV pilus assembly protein PilC
MPAFKWSGKDRGGVAQKGQIEAPDRQSAFSMLRRQGINATSVKARPQDFELNIPGLRPKVTDKDLVTFTRQFATMIDAGLPLVQCLDILGSQTENKTFGSTIKKVQADVEGGATFAEALKKHPRAFPELYVNMVAAGEAGGILDTILNRLASYIEKSMNLKKKVKGAMVYPTVVVGVACLVVALLLVFVIPTFEQMFSDFGGTLPLPTRLVIIMSEWMQRFWWAVLLGLGLLIFGVKQWRRTEQGQRILDGLALRLPVVGILVRKVAVAKFTRTLSTLIASGVPILDGLEIVAKTAGNKVIEIAILQTRQAISEGKTIAEPLGQTKVFPPMVVQMIGVGESAGALDSMLSKIADFYDEEVDQAVNTLSSMIEPFIMVFLGVVIGFIVVAMYLPVFKLAGTIE